MKIILIPFLALMLIIPLSASALKNGLDLAEDNRIKEIDTLHSTPLMRSNFLTSEELQITLHIIGIHWGKYAHPNRPYFDYYELTNANVTATISQSNGTVAKIVQVKSFHGEAKILLKLWNFTPDEIYNVDLKTDYNHKVMKQKLKFHVTRSFTSYAG